MNLCCCNWKPSIFSYLPQTHINSLPRQGFVYSHRSEGIPSDIFQALLSLISHNMTTSLQKHATVISHFHTKTVLSNSAYSHKKPVVVIIWQMTASCCSLPRPIWIPLHSMGMEYRTILSGLLPHSINLLTPPKSVGGDPQTERLNFVTSMFLIGSPLC